MIYHDGMSAPDLLYIAIGFVAALMGTLVGAGGGFILIPLLLSLFPEKSALQITAISIAVVFCNSFSGSLVYGLTKKISYKRSGLLAVAAFPGSLLGVFCIDLISRLWFERVFGLWLFFLAGILAWKVFFTKNSIKTELTDRDTHRAFVLMMGASCFVGFISSLLGIGGGIIFVPAMMLILRYPIHRATANSQFVLACTSFVTFLTHLWAGSYQGQTGLLIYLAVGALGGGQMGAKVSKYFSPAALVLAFISLLIFVGLRVIIRTFLLY